MKPMQPQYSWETQHDTANGTMTHTFNKLVKVVSNMHTGEAVVMVGDQAVQAYGNMPVKQYEEMLLEVEKKATVLATMHKIKAALVKHTSTATGNLRNSIGYVISDKSVCPMLAQVWKSTNN